MASITTIERARELLPEVLEGETVEVVAEGDIIMLANGPIRVVDAACVADDDLLEAGRFYQTKRTAGGFWFCTTHAHRCSWLQAGSPEVAALGASTKEPGMHRVVYCCPIHGPEHIPPPPSES